MQSTIRTAAIIGLLGFAVGYSIVAMRRSRAPQTAVAATVVHREDAPDPQYVYRVELGESPSRGPEDARVTIVEFSGYGCASCRAVEESLARLGPVRVVWKDVPISPGSTLAARAARAAARQGKFWEMHDRLAAAPDRIDEGLVERHATALGLDLTQFRGELLADPAIAEALAADAAQAQRFGLQTAPAIFINGKFVAEPSLERLRAKVQEAEAFAAQLVAEGTPPNKIYAALMRGALVRSGPITAEP